MMLIPDTLYYYLPEDLAYRCLKLNTILPYDDGSRSTMTLYENPIDSDLVRLTIDAYKLALSHTVSKISDEGIYVIRSLLVPELNQFVTSIEVNRYSCDSNAIDMIRTLAEQKNIDFKLI